jgi:chaperonin GroEL (HSP60 family)
MEAFSRALEAIPATLAENIGSDRLDTLLELRSLHRAGNKNSGVGKEGMPDRIEDAIIPATTILHSLEAACETTCGLIRVDQVISARGD